MKIQDYVSANKLNTPLQSVYKANHSTLTALLKIFNDILTEVDQGNVVTLLDLSAAFDTVNHDILLRLLRKSFASTHHHFQGSFHLFLFPIIFMQIIRKFGLP